MNALTVWDSDSGALLKRVEDVPLRQALVSLDDQWLAVLELASPQSELHLVDTETYWSANFGMIDCQIDHFAAHAFLMPPTRVYLRRAVKRVFAYPSFQSWRTTRNITNRDVVIAASLKS